MTIADPSDFLNYRTMRDEPLRPTGQEPEKGFLKCSG